MQRIDDQFIYSASDLNNYLECKRLTELDALVVRRKLSVPEVGEDELTQLIQRRGEEHERRYLEALIAKHPGDVVQFARSEPGIENYRRAEEKTLHAMQAGVRIIYQATFFDGQFIGHADFLRRIEVPSDLGDYRYEVIDTKLALELKPYFLIQLCNYSQHLERLQGRMPTFGCVILGDGEEQRFRLNDYMAYYRHLKSAFLAFVSDPMIEQIADAREYPYECKHCRICPWDSSCEQKRIDDDHLSLVAWMRRDQLAKLEAAGITRVTALANATDNQQPDDMDPETFTKLRRQASLQVRGRTSPRPIYELLEHEPPLGFALLPQPAPGDVFFDMEGDPLFDPGRGLEYLFGCWIPDESDFRAFWGLNREEEKRAFEGFVDFIVERRRRYPAMHVYHYASYEKSALRRLAQAHRTREEEIDHLLRGEVLVDLFAVVRQALVISEDGYGLKKLERFYELERGTDVKRGDESIVMFERWLLERNQQILNDIEAYNRDDCRSTHLLRDWLLERRAEAITAFGVAFPFRPVKSPQDPCHPEFVAACKKCENRRNEEREEARRSSLERTLLEHVLSPKSEEEYRLMSPAGRMRYLMANLMAYHRREEKPAWWEYYDRCENVDQLIRRDKEAIAGLKLREDIDVRKVERSFVYTFGFPDQMHKIKRGEVHNPRTKQRAGTILWINDEQNLLELKTTASLEQVRAITELIPAGPPPTKAQRASLARIAASFQDESLPNEHPATYDLLANTDPRVHGIGHLQPEDVTADSVSAVVQALEGSYLFVQGPPGSGKSTIGSEVICDLLQSRKRVAVMSTSHNAIHNLLHKVEEVMTRRGGTFRGRYKHSTASEDSEYESRAAKPFIKSEKTNEVFDNNDYDLAGGTVFLFSREELDGAFDYLFIDEAGQVALADALAASACAKNVVLLGDPSQLAQVSQGRQPLHVGDSVLQHLLGDAQTVLPHRGIFLDVSYRMQPAICTFISNAMYENRLRAAETTRMHRVILDCQDLAGIYFVPVKHTGNDSSSTEEADEVVRAIALLRENGTFVDSKPRELAGLERPVSDRDVIVVTPYNAQRRLILGKLHDASFGVEVGTVDKFQGQEAVVVFYSMATSSGEDLPRDVEFLFERNRFNVALSRARAVSVLFCSPRLLDISCRTPEEMALANLLCAFVERADPSFARKCAPAPRSPTLA